MFDIGWSEMLLVAVVAIIVVGPKDLPKMLRAFGKAIGGMRKMAGDFQRQFDDAVREAELDEIRDLANKRSFAPLEDVKKSAREFEEKFRADMTGGASSATKTDKKPAPLPEPQTAKKTSGKKPSVKSKAKKPPSKKDDA